MTQICWIVRSRTVGAVRGDYDMVISPHGSDQNMLEITQPGVFTLRAVCSSETRARRFAEQIMELIEMAELE